MSAVQLSQVFTKISSSRINEVSKKYNRFLWDVVYRYFTLLGVTLVAIGLGEEFFLERGLACNTPNEVNRDQYRFVVLWCSRHVRRIDLLPLLILVQALLIVAPQVLWEVYAASSFQQFFSLTPRLERLRSKETGNYDVDTTRIVRHLIEKYKNKYALQRFYQRKLVFQIIVSCCWIIMMLGMYEGGTIFDIDFVCREVPSEVYNINMSSTNVTCTYTTAEAFFPLWIADIILLLFATGFGIFGFVWLKISHWKELDHEGNADFYYTFSMNAGKYNPDNSHKFKQRMEDDLDFLTLVQFNSDRGQGETLYDVQVDLDLQEKWANDYEKYLNKLPKNGSDRSRADDDTNITSDDQLTQTSHAKRKPSRLNRRKQSERHHAQNQANDFMNVCLEDVPVPNGSRPYKRSLHLFCGSKGCTLALANISEETYAVDFNPFYYLTSKRKSTTGEVTKSDARGMNYIEENFSNIYHIRVPVDITSMTGPDSAKLLIRLRKVPGSEETTAHLTPLSYDLVFVNCLEPHFRASTAKVVLDILRPQLQNGCIILVCSPEKSLISEIMEDIKFLDSSPTKFVKDFVGNGQDEIYLQKYVVERQPDDDNELSLNPSGNLIETNLINNDFSDCDSWV